MGRRKRSKTPPSADVLSINTSFAEKYEETKRREFLSNAPAALLDQSDESSSTSEEEDEFGEMLTKRIDRKVHETLEAIRKKDPRIYDKNARFFDDAKEKDRDSEAASDSDVDSDDEPVAGWDTIANAAEQGTRKLTLKDYVRESLMKDGRLSDDDSDAADDVNEVDNHRQQRVPANGKHHSKEQTTSNSDHEHTDSDSATGNHENDEEEDVDEDDNDEDAFFTKKQKTSVELEEEEKDFEKFMKKQSMRGSKQAGEDLLLHSYLEKDTPDEKERFLRDFVLSNGWLDKNYGEAPGARDYEIEIDTKDPDSDDGQMNEDDDSFDEEADRFEAQYNFRFEDPDGAQIVSHARSVPGTMRRPDDRRKRARDAKRLRKEQEKAEKVEDIKKLKNMKKREIQARLLAIQDAAGDGVDLNGIDLDGDFDPETFNKQMESKFGDDYYAMNDERMKRSAKEDLSDVNKKVKTAGDEDEVPEDIREDVNRMMDEYYNLDFEDIVGGVPMRFQYKKVEPESFNMTTENILEADDKELNRLVSLKYLAPYRSRRDAQKQAWRVRAALKDRKRAKQKEQHAAVAPVESTVEDCDQDIAVATAPAEGKDSSSEAKSRKRKRRRSKSNANDHSLEPEKSKSKTGDDLAQDEQHHGSAPLDGNHNSTRNEQRDETDILQVSKKKKKKRKKSSGTEERLKLSESRLKAYGITS